MFAAMNITILTISEEIEPPIEPPVKRPTTAAITPMIAKIHAGMIFAAFLAPLNEKIPSRRESRPRMKNIAMPDTPTLSDGSDAISSGLNWLAPTSTITPRIMRKIPQIMSKIPKIFNIRLLVFKLVDSFSL